jgi:hypothetical protein
MGLLFEKIEQLLPWQSLETIASFPARITSVQVLTEIGQVLRKVCLPSKPHESWTRVTLLLDFYLRSDQKETTEDHGDWITPAVIKDNLTRNAMFLQQCVVM